MARTATNLLEKSAPSAHNDLFDVHVVALLTGLASNILRFYDGMDSASQYIAENGDRYSVTWRPSENRDKTEARIILIIEPAWTRGGLEIQQRTFTVKELLKWQLPG